MKKLLLLPFILISSLSFGQEATYQLNGITSYLTDNFLEKQNAIYYVNLNDFSLSYLPKSGGQGWRKRMSLPPGFSPAKSAIAPCNSSNNIIISVQSNPGNQNLIMKFDLNGTIVWSKIVSYNFPDSSSYNYGSNSTPLIVNDQDEILISVTLYDCLLLSKLDTNGNLIFSKRINSSDYMSNGKNPGFSVITTNDNGYLITMKNGSNPTITKLNQNLQVEWSKKWSIDGYSHPKLGLAFNNGNYCIIGEGDNGTYIAQIDPSGNLLSYKYNIELFYPYKCRILDNDSIELVDTYGRNVKINLTDNTISSKKFHHETLIYGSPYYVNDKINFLDDYYSKIYLNLESNQMGCINSTTSYSTLSELTVYPTSIANETIVITNIGSLTNYTPTIITSNDVYMTLTCGTLGVGEVNESSLTLYPNPSAAGKKVTLAIEKGPGYSFQLLTLSGKVMETYEMNETVFNAPQEAGMYFVQILDQTGNIIAVEKLVVE